VAYGGRRQAVEICHAADIQIYCVSTFHLPRRVATSAFAGVNAWQSHAGTLAVVVFYEAADARLFPLHVTSAADKHRRPCRYGNAVWQCLR